MLQPSRCLLLALTALSACTVGPDYHRPDPHAPVHWHQSLAPAASHPQETSAIEAQWWRIYRDPTLTALEEDVARNNLDLREAALHFTESQAERKIASAAQMPHMEGAASYARERASTNGILGLLGTMQQAGPGEVASGEQGFGPAAADGAKGNPSFNLPQYGLSEPAALAD